MWGEKCLDEHWWVWLLLDWQTFGKWCEFFGWEKDMFGAFGVPEWFHASFFFFFCVGSLKRGWVKKQAAMTAIISSFSCVQKEDFYIQLLQAIEANGKHVPGSTFLCVRRISGQCLSLYYVVWILGSFALDIVNYCLLSPGVKKPIWGKGKCAVNSLKAVYKVLGVQTEIARNEKQA